MSATHLAFYSPQDRQRAAQRIHETVTIPLKQSLSRKAPIRYSAGGRGSVRVHPAQVVRPRGSCSDRFESQ